ncbi:MAG: transglycosylase SLT domain-containing protein [Xanthomonadales bacterium]|nr:transglycosylase SLT domain-containing protein [Xanthomonadales bacterium]
MASRLLIRTCAAALLPLLAACAGSSTRPGPIVGPTQTEALLSMEQWALELEQAQAAEDQAIASERLIVAAATAADRARACAQVEDCDAKPVLARMAELGTAHAAWMSAHSVSAEWADAESAAVEVEASAGDESMAPVAATLTRFDGRELADVIVLNESVRASLNEWLTWMRPQLLETLDNYQSLRDDMWPAFERAGLPEAILFGILAKESNAKVHATSRVGAAGPLQFMPATGRRFGLGRAADGFDSRFDPAAAADAAVRYLQERFAEYDHDLTFALAAYNGGEGRLIRLHRQFPHASYWDATIQSRLPRETRDYVPMVLAAAWIFLHAEELDVPRPSARTDVTQVTLEAPASLNSLAICLGQDASRNGWFRALRNQNPRWLPHIELPVGTAVRIPSVVAEGYRTRCLAGERAELALGIAAAAKQHLASAAVATAYTVKRGDTLAAIARRHQCDTRQLASANNVKGPRYLIRPGQSLRLTGCRG